MNKTHIATIGERFFMSKIAIATDSNSGITQAQGRELGIFVMPMPFYINDELFLEDITLSQEQFYQRLEEGADVKTTQPAPGDVLELWDRILKDYDELVYIPMSSGLSSSYETAVMLAQDYGGRVQVVNNQRISVTLRQSALDAQALAAAGRSAAEIKALLDHAYARCREILSQNRQALDRTAEYLLEFETMSAEDFALVFDDPAALEQRKEEERKHRLRKAEEEKAHQTRLQAEREAAQKAAQEAEAKAKAEAEARKHPPQPPDPF